MKLISTFAALTFAAAIPALAADKVTIKPADVDAAVKSMFKSAPADWASRIEQDETQRICSETRNNPATADMAKIVARELATITFPADGIVLGDWKKGEKVAQSGAGGQFSDGPDTVKGGNCYACHQMAPSELSYGTLGPSLAGYGKVRKFEAVDAKAAYAKIFNAQSVQPCSMMPRFGYHKFLTVDQIKDVTAFLMSPDSPVNK
jgi:L-cysteine S-thiosulfotransferase